MQIVCVQPCYEQSLQHRDDSQRYICICPIKTHGYHACSESGDVGLFGWYQHKYFYPQKQPYKHTTLGLRPYLLGLDLIIPIACTDTS